MSYTTISYVLAGGQGFRLMPMTISRAKPAAGMGPSNRIMDYPYSNLINSDFRRILFLTEYQHESAQRHITQNLSRYVGGIDQFVRAVSPHRDQEGLKGYAGTASAIEKNLRYIDEDVSKVNILAGDHVYFMDFGQIHDFHSQTRSEFSISAIPTKVELAAKKYGVLKVDEQGRVLEFQEKPETPAEIPGMPGYCLASMGIYTANAQILKEFLDVDSKKETPLGTDGKPDKKKIVEDHKRFSSHDFGYDIIPALLGAEIPVFAYDFTTNNIPYRERVSNERKEQMPEAERGYWKDVGNIQQFFEANMELVAEEPRINIYNPLWPLYGARGIVQPSKDVDRKILFGDGVIFRGGELYKCILGDGSSVERSRIKNSILLGDNFIEEGCVIENAILDKGIHVPAGTVITPHSELAERLYQENEHFVQDGKIILPKGFKF